MIFNVDEYFPFKLPCRHIQMVSIQSLKPTVTDSMVRVRDKLTVTKPKSLCIVLVGHNVSVSVSTPTD